MYCNQSSALADIKIVTLMLLTLSLSGCDTAPIPSNSQASPSDQSLVLNAYRIRTNTKVPLNEESWSTPINTPAVVTADQPFRLRVEIENHQQNPNPISFSLQYRRNNGQWQSLTAEDFPYPTKKVELDFSEAEHHASGAELVFQQGEKDALSWVESESEAYLSIDSGASPIVLLGDFKTYWEAEEFKAALRVSKGDSVGLMFAFQNVANHYRLDIEGDGLISLVERRDGIDSTLKTFDAKVRYDQWIEVGVTSKNDEITIEYEWDPIEEGMVWEFGVEKALPLASTGLYLPEQSTADFNVVEVSADAYSPLASIVSNAAYRHGDATTDLLASSSLPFVAGSGTSFAPSTPAWVGANAQGEWEFPIVLRYFADGAQNNLDGDQYDFRVVDDTGSVLDAKLTPSVTLQVPDGHLGGTFVETPGRLGPWQGTNGDMYFLMEPSETDNKMMIVKSTDGGKRWKEADGEHRPKTGDLEGVATHFDGEHIHILHQTSDDVLYHVFQTGKNGGSEGWVIQDEKLASPSEPPVQVADLVVRSDGSVVGIYGDLHKLRYRVRSPAGKWSDPTIIEPDTARDLSGPVMAIDNDDTVHLAYTGFDGTAWYRQISANGALSEPMLISDELGTEVEDASAILPLVYLPESNEVSIVFRMGNGQLWETRVGERMASAVQVSEKMVVRNAADSEQVGADMVVYGQQVHVLFIEQDTGRLYHTVREGENPWSEPTLQVEGENILWVRGAIVFDGNGDIAYGFIYDGGSEGGSGMNRYSEVFISHSQ